VWNAPFVAITLVAIQAILCATTVCAALVAWSAAKKLRSTTSMQGELREIREYVEKLDHWAKRINARETMRERRAAERVESSTPVSTSNVTDKDELRRRAGLVAGKPARHREAS
jgi:hypothetical protein